MFVSAIGHSFVEFGIAYQSLQWYWNSVVGSCVDDRSVAFAVIATTVTMIIDDGSAINTSILSGALVTIIVAVLVGVTGVTVLMTLLLAVEVSLKFELCSFCCWQQYWCFCCHIGVIVVGMVVGSDARAVLLLAMTMMFYFTHSIFSLKSMIFLSQQIFF